MTPFIPPITPAETMNSYCADVLVFGESGQKPHRLSSEGPPIGGPVMHSVAIGVRKFCSVTEGILGTPDDLIENHSIYRYHASACSTETQTALWNWLMDSTSSRLHLPRLLAPIELERTPRLYCPVCRKEQLAAYGRSGRLTYHVLPLVQMCAMHKDVPLVDETRPKKGSVLARPSTAYITSARRFAQMSARLLSLAGPEAIAEFRAELRARLVAAGFYRPNGSLRASRLDEAMRSYYEGSAFDVRLRTLATGEQRASHTVHWLLDAVRTQHPVFVVLLAMLLDGSEIAERFGVRTVVSHECVQISRQEERTEASKPVVHSRWTAYGRRITELLRRGYSPKRVAALLSIPVDRVYHLIRRDGLWGLVNTLRMEGEREKRRHAWLEALKRWPDRSTNFVRNRVPRVYRWLYKNDKDWLLEHGTGVHTWNCAPSSHRRRPYGADAKLASHIIEIGRATCQRIPAVRCSRRLLVIETGLTQSSFEDALRWKRVAEAVTQAEESVSAFHARVKAFSGGDVHTKNQN